MRPSERKYLYIRKFPKIKQDWPLYNGPFHSDHHEKRTFFHGGKKFHFGFHINNL